MRGAVRFAAAGVGGSGPAGNGASIGSTGLEHDRLAFLFDVLVRFIRGRLFRQLVPLVEHEDRVLVGAVEVARRFRVVGFGDGLRRFETLERGILDDEQAIEVRGAAVKFHGARFVVGLFVRPGVGGPGRRQVGNGGELDGRGQLDVLVARQLLDGHRVVGRGRIAFRGRPERLLAQVLERIEGRRAHAAAHVALCEAQRFGGDAKDRCAIRALGIHAYSARRRPASRVQPSRSAAGPISNHGP